MLLNGYRVSVWGNAKACGEKKTVAVQHGEATKATELCIERWLKWWSLTHIFPLLFKNESNTTHVTVWVSGSF